MHTRHTAAADSPQQSSPASTLISYTRTLTTLPETPTLPTDLAVSSLAAPAESSPAPFPAQNLVSRTPSLPGNTLPTTSPSSPPFNVSMSTPLARSKRPDDASHITPLCPKSVANIASLSPKPTRLATSKLPKFSLAAPYRKPSMSFRPSNETNTFVDAPQIFALNLANAQPAARPKAPKFSPPPPPWPMLPSSPPTPPIYKLPPPPSLPHSLTI